MHVTLFVCGTGFIAIHLASAGDQASSGNCQSFKWGGTSGLHWYTCCNNCNDTDKSCDGKTYQTASTDHYCGSCGTDIGPNKPRKWKGEFSCGLCPGQNSVQRKCTKSLRKVYEIPGFCWAFTRCFKDRCKKKYSTNLATYDAPDPCFTLTCDDGESVQNCPTDCCYRINPEQCTWANNTCLPECCGETTCCHSSSAESLGFISTWLVIGNILLKIFLSNIVVFF